MRCRVTANRFAASDIVILPARVVAIVFNCTRVNKGIKSVISTPRIVQETATCDLVDAWRKANRPA
jgi:hypothetical protein